MEQSATPTLYYPHITSRIAPTVHNLLAYSSTAPHSAWKFLLLHLSNPPLAPSLTLIRSQVHQGYFDILFPSDFRTLSLIYQAITGRFVRTSSHADFMGRWADLVATECANGDNPLVGWYGNQRVLWTV